MLVTGGHSDAPGGAIQQALEPDAPERCAELQPQTAQVVRWTLPGSRGVLELTAEQRDGGLDERYMETQSAILEDFMVAGFGGVGALVLREASDAFLDGVGAAAVSAGLGVSFAYALKHYVPMRVEPELPPVYEVFQAIYFLGKRHISGAIERAQVRDDPLAGAVFANTALRRLQGTYFAIGLLFRTGYLLEANALARVFLEQVAWAYRVRSLDDPVAVAKVAPSKAVTHLK